MKIYRTITLSLLLFLTAAGVRAQEQNDRELYRSWMQGQRAILSSLSEFSVHADIKHAVKSGGGERVMHVSETGSWISRVDVIFAADAKCKSIGLGHDNARRPYFDIQFDHSAGR